MFQHAWQHRVAKTKDGVKRLLAQVQIVENKIKLLIERIMNSDSQNVITAYENEINTLEKQKVLLAEKADKRGKPQHSFEKMFEHCMKFLSNPCKLWDSEELTDKRMVLKLTFSGRIAYNKENGFRTPNFSLPFKVLGENKDDVKKMVGREGFEPSTNGLKVHCSTN